MSPEADPDPTQADPPPGFEPIVSSNPFGGRNGPLFERCDGDGWVRGFRVGPHHCNAGGVAHGGMLMTFADIVLARAVMEVADRPFVTIRLVSDFVGPATEGVWVEGRAWVTRTTRSVVFVDGTLAARGKPVLSLSGLFKLLDGAR